MKSLKLHLVHFGWMSSQSQEEGKDERKKVRFTIVWHDRVDSMTGKTDSGYDTWEKVAKCKAIKEISRAIISIS